MKKTPKKETDPVKRVQKRLLQLIEQIDIIKLLHAEMKKPNPKWTTFASAARAFRKSKEKTAKPDKASVRSASKKRPKA